jgi:tetratricopeptide (TPR) repeat protein
MDLVGMPGQHITVFCLMRYIIMKILLLLLIVAPLLLNGQQIFTASADHVVYETIHRDVSSGDVKDAIRTFEKLVSQLNDDGRSEELPQQYFGMAFTLALNGNYKESIRYHKKAIRAHRKYRNDEPLEISINLGLTYHLAGKDRKARRILGDTI